MEQKFIYCESLQVTRLESKYDIEFTRIAYQEIRE
uniref:Uncharacterized protein n=1 Tax=Arundo donax TaxID=35708 RepID=A0A0A9GQW8_ARUDO